MNYLYILNINSLSGMCYQYNYFYICLIHFAIILLKITHYSSFYLKGITDDKGASHYSTRQNRHCKTYKHSYIEIFIIFITNTKENYL